MLPFILAYTCDYNISIPMGPNSVKKLTQNCTMFMTYCFYVNFTTNNPSYYRQTAMFVDSTSSGYFTYKTKSVSYYKNYPVAIGNNYDNEACYELHTNTNQMVDIILVAIESQDRNTFTVISAIPNDYFTVVSSEYSYKYDYSIHGPRKINYINIGNPNYLSFKSYASDISSGALYVPGYKPYTLSSSFRVNMNNASYLKITHSFSNYKYKGFQVETTSNLLATSGLRIALSTGDSSIVKTDSKITPTHYDYKIDSSGSGGHSGLNRSVYIAVVVVSVYFSFCMFLLFIDIIAACIHPNRLYRAGITWSCCYCCCFPYYSPSSAYYSSHTYSSCYCCDCGPVHSDSCCNCCDCHDCNCGGNDDYAAAIVMLIVLIIVLLVLIFMSVILIHIFINLVCSYDEEERAWEKSYKRSNLNQSIYRDDMSMNSSYPVHEEISQPLTAASPYAPPPGYQSPPPAQYQPPPQQYQPPSPYQAPANPYANQPYPQQPPMYAPPPNYDQKDDPYDQK